MWTLLIFLPFSEAIFCKQCFNYNGQVCVNAQDCNGNYCLFEEILQTNGVQTTRKTCVSQPYFQYPDGSFMTKTNQCTDRNTNVGLYKVKICNDQDYCNEGCSSSVLPVPYTLHPPTTFPPIASGMGWFITKAGNRFIVQCFNCETYDGTDCRTNVCQGRYCLYERKITAGSMTIRKSCLQDADVVLDDGTFVQTVDVCEIRNTLQSQYFIKICQDQDFCNGYCNPQAVTEPPQRQPLVTCDCDTGICQNNRCQAPYCLYQRESRNGQIISTRRSCSQTPFILYPDNTYSTEMNQCELKTINDINYQVKVCNNRDHCNTDCSSGSSQPPARTITCTQCDAVNTNDCTGSTCIGNYCLYQFQASQTNGNTAVKKSCTFGPDVVYPDGTMYRSFGSCESRSYNGVTYTVKLCNSTNNCNSPCNLSPVTASPLPTQSSADLSSMILFISTIVYLLLV